MIAIAALLLSLLPVQDVPPPPRPKDNGPSLEETMKYVQDRLNSVDVGYKSAQHREGLSDILETRTFKIYDAEADASRCALSWRLRLHVLNQSDGKDWAYTMEIDFRLSFRDIGKLTVGLQSDARKRNGLSVDYYPPVSDLLIKTVPGKTVHVHLRATADTGQKIDEHDSEDPETVVSFTDEEIAQRLAKAIVHAVELCGGGDKDPFI
jgi:hypothetical protein